MNLNKFITQLLLSFLVLIFFYACSSGKIADKEYDFEGFTEIQKGQDTTIAWNFPNADEVKIEGFREVFSPMDSLKVSPTITTRYKFKVTNKEDTLELVWRVFIKNEESVQTGPNFMEDQEFTPSYTENKYVKGVINSDYSQVKSIRVTAADISSSKDYANLNALILDEFGNFIEGLESKNQYVYSYRIICGDDTSSFNSFVPIERTEPKSLDLDYCLLLDNSIIASSFASFEDYIDRFVFSFHNKDRIGYYYFNHKFDTLLSVINASEINVSKNMFQMKYPSGLNAQYKALNQGLNILNTDELDNKKVLVLVTFSKDNSSLVYDRNEIVKKAINSNIPIYTIGVGDAVDSYSLKYLSQFTGANYYFVSNNNLFDVQDVMKEILFSQRKYYEIKLSLSDIDLENCDKVKFELLIQSDSIEVKSKHSIRTKAEKHYFDYQAVCSFDYRDSTIKSEYKNLIKELADLMILNPDKKVELIGNASIEGPSSYCRDISLLRAQEVRRLLLEFGVAPENIRVRAEGSNNPIYYMQDEEWQKYLNRRVEMRWLEPELLPYEIIADNDDTETGALEKVELWEQKGFRSYYQRYLNNNVPIYRIKIWGFPTLDSAQNVAKNLERNFNMQFIVQ